MFPPLKDPTRYWLAFQRYADLTRLGRERRKSFSYYNSISSPPPGWALDHRRKSFSYQNSVSSGGPRTPDGGRCSFRPLFSSPYLVRKEYGKTVPTNINALAGVTPGRLLVGRKRVPPNEKRRMAPPLVGNWLVSKVVATNREAQDGATPGLLLVGLKSCGNQ